MELTYRLPSTKLMSARTSSASQPWYRTQDQWMPRQRFLSGATPKGLCLRWSWTSTQPSLCLVATSQSEPATLIITTSCSHWQSTTNFPLCTKFITRASHPLSALITTWASEVWQLCKACDRPLTTQWTRSTATLSRSSVWTHPPKSLTQKSSRRSKLFSRWNNWRNLLGSNRLKIKTRLAN